MPTIDEIVIADPPEVWRSIGFSVEGDICTVRTVAIRLAGREAGNGIVRWSVRHISSHELDGLATTASPSPPRQLAPAHPNGVRSLDHVVAFSPNLDRTVVALERAGLPLRRIREEPTPAGAPRQAFFRLGEEILEVIQQPDSSPGFDPAHPARLWGLAFEVDRLEPLTEKLGDLLGRPRDAVQQGRRIVTLRREAGVGAPIAFMTPAVS